MPVLDAFPDAIRTLLARPREVLVAAVAAAGSFVADDLKEPAFRPTTPPPESATFVW